MDADASVETLSKQGNSAFAIAALNGHVACLELLGRTADVNQADKQERTPLFKACNAGHVDAIRWLVSHGARVDVCPEEVAFGREIDGYVDRMMPIDICC